MKRIVLSIVVGIALAGGHVKSLNVQTDALQVWMDNITVKADGTTSAQLKVYEKDAERNYTAFNMSLIVPAGISVKQVTKNRDMVNSIELSERAAATHTISCNMPKATLLKVICSSSQNDDLYPDDAGGTPMDELFTIELVADPSMENSTYTVTTEGVVFAHNDAGTTTGYIPAVQPSFQLTVTGGKDTPTGIGNTAAESEESDEWYDLEGRRTRPSRRGVYVQRGKKKAKQVE